VIAIDFRLSMTYSFKVKVYHAALATRKLKSISPAGSATDEARRSATGALPVWFHDLTADLIQLASIDRCGESPIEQPVLSP
jgi:hypothetical protein